MLKLILIMVLIDLVLDLAILRRLGVALGDLFSSTSQRKMRRYERNED